MKNKKKAASSRLKHTSNTSHPAEMMVSSNWGCRIKQHQPERLGYHLEMTIVPWWNIQDGVPDWKTSRLQTLLP